MQEEPHLQLTFETIGDIDSMLVKPNAISSPSVKPQYQYYSIERLLNQITKEQLAIMISTLKVNKGWICSKGKQPLWNLYQNVFLIVLLKINQFQLCSKVRSAIFVTIAKLIGRTKEAIGQRTFILKNLDFNLIWFALEKEHDLFLDRVESNKNFLIKCWDPQQYSLVYDAKQKKYHLTHLNAQRWNVLGNIPKKNNLSLEQMEKLERIYQLLADKNLLASNSCPKDKWEILFQSDIETKSQFNDLSSQENNFDREESCNEKSYPSSAQSKRARIQKCLPFTIDSVGYIFEMQIVNDQKARRNILVTKQVASLQPILDQITGEKLQKMLLFLRDGDNRAHLLKIQKKNKKKSKRYIFHTFEDILILSLLKVNQYQLDHCNYFIILKKCQHFLRRSESGIKQRINFLSEVSFENIWQDLFYGNLLSRNFFRTPCLSNCCLTQKKNNMCQQDSKKQKLTMKQIEKINLIISMSQNYLSSSTEYLPMKAYLLNNEKPRNISPHALENNDGKEEQHWKIVSEIEQKEKMKEQFDFVKNSSIDSLDSEDDGDLDGFQIEQEDESEVTKGNITRTMKEKLSSFAKQALANPKTVQKCFIFRRLDRQEVFQIRLKEILFEVMRLVRRRKEISDGVFATMQNYLSALRQVSRLENRRELSRVKEVRRKERLARRKPFCSGLESQNGGGPSKTKRREKSLQKEASTLSKKFLTMGGLGARLSECTETMADVLT